MFCLLPATAALLRCLKNFRIFEKFYTLIWSLPRLHEILIMRCFIRYCNMLLNTAQRDNTVMWSYGGFFVVIVITLRLRQNGCHFPDNNFKCIFLYKNVRILIKISPKFDPRCPINTNIPALVQIMAWHRTGNKPLSEPMMVSLLMHIWVTRPQWVNDHYSDVTWASSHLRSVATQLFVQECI